MAGFAKHSRITTRKNSSRVFTKEAEEIILEVDDFRAQNPERLRKI